MSFAGNAALGFLQNTVTNNLPCNQLYASARAGTSKKKKNNKI